MEIKNSKEENTKKISSPSNKEKLTYNNSNIMEYLNDTYLNSLSYKDMIVDNTWYIGKYKDSIKDIKTDTVKAKVKKDVVVFEKC